MGSMNQTKNSMRLFIIVLMLLFPLTTFAKENKDSKEAIEIPSHVLNISKENTFPNVTEDQEVVEPSALTKELVEAVDIAIENPNLIKLLNETSIKTSPIALGYRGEVYLGRWALNYESTDTTINWEYQKINQNELNNIGGDQPQVMSYNQEERKEIQGALTNKIKNPEDVKMMILMSNVHGT